MNMQTEMIAEASQPNLSDVPTKDIVIELVKRRSTVIEGAKTHVEVRTETFETETGCFSVRLFPTI